MEVDKIKPAIIGVFLALLLDTPFFTRKSERKPAERTPINAAIKGKDAKNPVLIKDKPRYSTK